MSAQGIVRHLIEEPENHPLDTGPLEPYLGPVEFDSHVKDIIKHARFLKEQAEEAGALALLLNSGKHKLIDIDRAFLTIAAAQYNDEFRDVNRIVRILNREMHSIWT